MLLKVSLHSSMYDESFLSLCVQYLFQVYLDFAAIHGPFLAPTKRIISEIRAACPTFIDANLIIVTDVGFFFLGAELQSENCKKLVHIAVSAPPLPGPSLATRHMCPGPGLKSRPGHSFSQAPGPGLRSRAQFTC